MRKILASVATNLVRIVSLLLATATTMALSLVLVFLVPLFLQFFYQIPKSWNHDGPIATDPIFWAFWLSFSFGPAVLAFLVPPIGNWIQDQGFGVRKPSVRENAVIAQVNEKLTVAAKQNKRRIFQVVYRMMDDDDTNAFAYGSNRIVFTTDMLRKYAAFPNQVDMLAAIAAHELGHHKNLDTFFGTIQNFLFYPLHLAIFILNLLFSWIPVLSQINFLFVAVSQIPLFLSQFLSDFTRQMVEYRADAFAARLLGPKHFADILDDFGKTERWKGGGVLVSMQRSHPPSELRRDRILKEFGHLVSSDRLHAQTVE